MENTGYRNFGQKLAMHTAPTLLGIKCASLLSLRIESEEVCDYSAYFNYRVSAKGLKSRILCSCRSHTLLLVYHEKLLTARLADRSARKVLENSGYASDWSLEECLSFLAQRIQCSSEFPHEIGIFLGYPTEDVLGFIANHGDNYKFCGCWKVYGCEESAKRTFANYEKCRKFLCNKLNEGADLYQALKLS
ncbi:MAG: DUF3793 family protein [Ruminococcus sp.]|nr:DUF3793 family protein [Ruminococcus sp.]